MNARSILFSGVFAIVFFSGTLTGGQRTSDVDCENPETTAAMRHCANIRYGNADAELNRIYRQLSANLDEVARKKLRDAQRAWIAFRDANAEFVADSARGGTLQPLLDVATKAAMTETRLEELRQHLH